MITSQFDKF